MKGANLLVETLERGGVTHTFGVAGSVVLGTLDRIAQSDIEYIPARHEQVATGMATGYSLVTREPSVTLAHVGPGAANQIIGMSAAYRDNIPVVAITGNEPSFRLGKDVRHEWDVTDIFSRFTKLSVRMGTDWPHEQIRDALVRSVTGMPGPVHIDVPRDLEEADVPDPDEGSLERLDKLTLRAPRVDAHPSDETVEKVATLLSNAEQPIVIVGNEARWFDATSAVRRFAERIDIPVATAQNARGVLPETHPLSLGVVGRIGLEPTNEYVQNADFILGVGTRFSDLTTGNWELIPDDATLVHATVREREMDRHYLADVTAYADPSSFLTALTDHFDRTGSELSFEAYARAYHEELEEALEKHFDPEINPTDERVDPRKLVTTIDEVAGDYAFATGGGVHSRFANRLPVDELNGYIGTDNFAGMSQGFPLAMGAQLALDKPVFAIEGDGGFSMVMQDLETAVREDIPVKIVVMNNHGMISQAARQKRYYGERYTGTLYPNPDFASVARNFGMFGEQVTEDDQIQGAVERLVETDGPGLLDVHINRWLGTEEYDRD